MVGVAMTDLAREFALAVDNIRPMHVERFRSLGFPDRVLYAGPPLVGLARVTTYSDGFFEFHDNGDPAVIIAEGFPACPDWDPIEDLIAFKPASPTRWWRRLGTVDLLGGNQIRRWRLSPLTVCETPLSWLQTGAGGTCVVNWAFDPIATLLTAGPLEAETGALRARLERRIQSAALAKFQISVSEACHAV
jgi:hypothetical protein